jgi:hypothetical protein
MRVRKEDDGKEQDDGERRGKREGIAERKLAMKREERAKSNVAAVSSD